jgi:hypothetical protein
LRIGREILQHILVNFFLQVDPDRSVNPNDFIRADTRVRWNITARVGDSDIFGNIPNGMARAFECSAVEPLKKISVRG